jgi:hypothetical protein
MESTPIVHPCASVTTTLYNPASIPEISSDALVKPSGPDQAYAYGGVPPDAETDIPDTVLSVILMISSILMTRISGSSIVNVAPGAT